MKIQLKQLFEIEGELLDINSSLDLSDVKLGMSNPFTEPVCLSGKVFNRAGIVSLSYTATATLHTACDRCATLLDLPVALSFVHVLVKQVNDDSNDELIVVPNLVLDLDELASSDMILELPSKVLCKEDCKGLCQKCGCNLNEQSCSCTRKQVDPRLEILSKLLEK